MGFKRPFRTTPIRMGKVYRRRHQRSRRASFAATALMFGAVTLAVFTAGMIYTHPSLLPLPAQAEAGPQAFAADTGFRTPALARDPVRTAAEVTEASASGRCSGRSVHDGDTIRCGRERVRLADIDAPELPDSPKCQDGRRSYAWCDFDAGYRSRDALRAFLQSGKVEVYRQGEDKYGRTLAIVSVNGVSAGDYLISLGLAKPWR